MKILLFILLKLAEFYLLIRVPYLIGKLSLRGGDIDSKIANIALKWLVGLGIMIIIFASFMALIAGIDALCNGNWWIVNQIIK